MESLDPSASGDARWADAPTTPNPVYPPASVAAQPTAPQPPLPAAHETQRLPPPPRQGTSMRLVAAVAALSLLLGGGAGAGAGALIAHSDTGGANAGASAASPVTQTERVTVGDVSSLTVSVVQQVGPAVVSILNDQVPTQDFFGNTSQDVSAGSGIIIDKNGYILTNDHVVAQAQTLKVTFANGTTTTATVVGSDAGNDIAVIKVGIPVPAVAQFGDSSTVKPGETVIAIGNALGNLQNTVTEGIVSGLGRSLPNGNDPTGNTTLQNLIQTDAAINHGNSGGPLVDLTGHVIGINTAVVRGSSTAGAAQNGDQAQGLGFAIPSNTAKAVADRLIFHTPTAFLGVDYMPISSQIASAYGKPVGAVVRAVVAGSPAAHAGLKVNDIITAVNGQAIDDQHDLKTVVDAFPIGSLAHLSVYRAGKTLTLTVKLAPRPAS